MLWAMGANERQPWASKVQPYLAAPLSITVFAPARYSSQSAGILSGRPAAVKIALFCASTITSSRKGQT